MDPYESLSSAEVDTLLQRLGYHRPPDVTLEQAKDWLRDKGVLGPAKVSYLMNKDTIDKIYSRPGAVAWQEEDNYQAYNAFIAARIEPINSRAAFQQRVPAISNIAPAFPGMGVFLPQYETRVRSTPTTSPTIYDVSALKLQAEENERRVRNILSGVDVRRLTTGTGGYTAGELDALLLQLGYKPLTIKREEKLSTVVDIMRRYGMIR